MPNISTNLAIEPVHNANIIGVSGIQLSASCRGRITPPVLMVLALVGALLSKGEVLADDECGVITISALAATAVCDGIASNTGAGTVNITPNSDVGDTSPFSGGISYTNLNGMTLNVRDGVTVARGPGSYYRGIFLQNNTSDTLAINLSTGVKISVDGFLADGVYLLQDGQGAIDIVSGANITTNNPDTSSVQSGANGLTGMITDPASTAAISIEQLAGSLIKTTGRWSLGLYGETYGLGSVFLTSSGEIKTDGEFSYGMNAVGGDAGNAWVELTDFGIIATTGDNAAGMYALNFGSGGALVKVAGTVDTTGKHADAVLANASTATGFASVEVAKSANLTTWGYKSAGAWAYTSGTGETTLSSAGHVETHGDNSAGLLTEFRYDPFAPVVNSASMLITVSSGASISTTGKSSYGILAKHDDSGHITIAMGAASDLITSGDSSDGVRGIGKGVIDIAIAGQVSTKGDASSGVYAWSSADKATIWHATGSAITADGANSAGIRAAGDTGAQIASNGTVSAAGEYGVGLMATTQTGAAEIAIGAGTTVTGGWQATTSGVGAPLGVAAAGVQIGSGGTSLLTNYGTIQAGSDRAIGQVGAAGSLRIENYGTVTGFVELAGGGGNIFNNRSFNSFDIRHFVDTDLDGIRDTKRVAISDFGGPGAVFNNFAPGAVRFLDVLGAKTTDASGFYLPTTGTNSRALDVAFYDMAREGVVQGQFTNLATFNNAGLVDLRGPAVGNTLVMTANGAAGGPAGNGVFVSNGGALYLNAILNAGIPVAGQTGSNADMLIVDGTQLGTGATTISVTNKGGLGAATLGNGIELVEVRNKAASAARAFALNGDYVNNGQQALVAGAYGYTLNHNGVGADADDGNWYLRSTAYQPGVPLYEAYPNTLLRLNTLPTLRQRVGDNYRGQAFAPSEPETIFCKDASQNFRCTINNEQAAYYLDAKPSRSSTGIWGRIEAGHDRIDPRLSTSDMTFATNALQVQAGVDALLVDSDQGRLIAALTAQYGTARSDIVSANGEGSIDTTAYGLGGSLTWLGETGFYADAQAQLNRSDSTLYSRTLGHSMVSHNNGIGYAVGVEVGQDVRLGDSWMLTPQIQLTYSTVDFDPFVDPYSAPVSLAKGDSLRGRLGLGSRYQSTWKDQSGEASSLDATATLNLYNEFLDGTQVDVAGARFSSDGDRLWGGIGLGGTYHWADGKYALHGEISGTTSLMNFGKSASLSGTLGLTVKW